VGDQENHRNIKLHTMVCRMGNHKHLMDTVHSNFTPQKGKCDQLFLFIDVSQAQVKPSSCTGKRKWY
jgi:hypothetical protein